MRIASFLYLRFSAKICVLIETQRVVSGQVVSERKFGCLLE